MRHYSAILILLSFVLGHQALAANLTIATQGNNMAFDKKTLQVKPGEMVTLTFKNAADKNSGLEHSWVLVKPGTADEVAAKAPAAGPTQGYVPDDTNILAHTRLLKAGESQTIRFKAPSQPGRYPYLCTYPAHSQLLTGTLEVG